MNEPLIMLTVNETAQKYGVAIHAVRGWIKRGELAVVKCGKKFLICEDNLREFLLRGNNQQEQEYQQIRRIGR